MTEKKERYLRPKFVVELYKSGMTRLEDLIHAVMSHENNLILRKSYGCVRDKNFYKKVVHLALSDAIKSGEIDGYEIKTRRSRSRR